jgi:hypothetical protein
MREEPAIVDDVEQAHDLAHPATDNRQGPSGLVSGPSAFDLFSLSTAPTQQRPSRDTERLAINPLVASADRTA